MGSHNFHFNVNANNFFITKIVPFNPCNIFFFSCANKSRYYFPNWDIFRTLDLRKYPFYAKQIQITVVSKMDENDD